MAAVKKLPSGNYQVRWLTPEGLSRKKTFRLKADADRYAAAMVTSKADGVYIDSAAGKVTFQAYAEQTSSRRGPQCHLEGHDRGADLPVGPDDLQGGIADRVIPTSPCGAIKLPNVDVVEVVPMEPETVEALADTIAARYRTLIILGAGTGLRITEALGLTNDRVDWIRRTAKIDRQLVRDGGAVPVFGPGKDRKNRPRTVPLPTMVVNALAEHVKVFGLGPSGLLFTNTKGEAVRRSTFSENWRAAAARRSLRRTRTEPSQPSSLMAAENQSAPRSKPRRYTRGLRLHALRRTRWAATIWPDPAQPGGWGRALWWDWALARPGHRPVALEYSDLTVGTGRHAVLFTVRWYGIMLSRSRWELIAHGPHPSPKAAQRVAQELRSSLAYRLIGQIELGPPASSRSAPPGPPLLPRARQPPAAATMMRGAREGTTNSSVRTDADCCPQESGFRIDHNRSRAWRSHPIRMVEDVFAHWVEEREFTPLSVVRVITENSNWLLTADRYQRLPRTEQPRLAVDSIDGRLNDAHWHEMQRCWWIVYADGAAAVRILPVVGPSDGVGIVTGPVERIEGEWVFDDTAADA